MDPFAGDRLLSSEASGPPHLSLAVGDPLLTDIANGLLPDGALETAGLLGMPLEITPEIATVHLAVTATDVCADCVDVDVTASGTASLTTSLIEAPFIPWRARAGAPIRLESEATDTGLRLQAQWGALPVRTAVELQQLPPTIEALASGFIGGWLETTLTDALRSAVHIATLDTTGVPLLSLRAVPDEVLRIDGYLSAPVEIEQPTDLPDPGNGWVLVVPNQSLLALARHNAMRDADKAYYIEPTVLEVDGSTLNAQIRIWRGGRKEHYKSVMVEGIISVRDGDIMIAPTLAETFASQRWRGGLDTAILTAKLRKWVQKGEIRLNGSLPTPAGRIRLTKVSGETDHLIIRGTFESKAKL